MVKDPLRGQADSIGDRAVVERTGRGRAEWFDLLDAAGAPTWGHAAIARWLTTEHAVDGWWAQSVTVAYEQARGLRAPGQRPDGTFEASVSRAMDAAPEACQAWFLEEERRGRWLDVVPELRGVSRTIRWTWTDGTRVTTSFQPLPQGRTRITVTHHGLPDGEVLADLKGYWSARLDALRELLAG
ncbi:SRPBCC domain-containing protein [Actinotalea sp. C106]|uniref:SRPBCC domain-containing protein n=1 Tax=Actinotalea sp. C106 TaxID=2908644 RepID=UPI0020283965|nr:SRPBCC domain-containing protein [Actinotalea sp. C106]